MRPSGSGGIVQGVGFRPHVWRLANELGLSGEIANDGDGVIITAWGDAAALATLCERIAAAPPPLALIVAVEREPLPGLPMSGAFRIGPSRSGAVSTAIAPDAAVCPDCLAELNDPTDRRYGHAFICCTNCGPRFSVLESLPYDRSGTSLAAFAPCPDCARDYRDPAGRRLHAQAIACPACGPRLWLEDSDGSVRTADPVREAALRLQRGDIVAIKGIGGFHLACDATSEAAVERLRRRKARPDKPLAVMARDLAQIRSFAEVSPEEEAMLRSPAAPVVLLPRAGGRLAAAIAPGLDRIGVLLPNTPLHHLLLAAHAGPVVLTSANRSSEPQVTDNADARQRLIGIADSWLMHDRAIVNRVDDSVVRQDAHGSTMLRRARGFVPAPVAGGFDVASSVLAMGGEQKSSFCLVRQGMAYPSAPMGDLEDAGCFAAYRQTLAHWCELFRFRPEVIAVDQHPDYLSTQWGQALADTTGARLVRVQHHHAHLASCLAEHGLTPGNERSIGIILDGLGLGQGGTLWGGEVLVGGYAEVHRVAHLLPVALPGGARAVREPWRNAIAHLAAAFGEGWLDQIHGLPLADHLASRPVEPLLRMIALKLNAPPASSAGRLFDAVAALVGISPLEQSYEGQAAARLEALARPHLDAAGAYPVAIETATDPHILSFAPLWAALLEDMHRAVPPGMIAARFHRGLAAALTKEAVRAAGRFGCERVVLSGGVLQNAVLAELLRETLTGEGLRTLLHTRVSPGDEGLSVGQAAIAALTPAR
ncbi:MAG: carbamoyltransferase HypF [Devosia sp.]|nr:carbamoyltransferase HypF [Devosia sp.]